MCDYIGWSGDVVGWGLRTRREWRVGKFSRLDPPVSKATLARILNGALESRELSKAKKALVALP